MSLDVGGRWCPACRAEYRPGFTRCADCDLPLVDADPRPAQDDLGGHDYIQYDLADWDVARRRAIVLLLLGQSVPYTWDGPILNVPHAREDEVDELIDETDETSEQDPAPAEAEEHDEVVIAFPVRRLAGALADALMLGWITFSAQRVAFEGSPTVHRLVTVAVAAAYFIVPTAIWGRTVGKALAGTTVVAAADLAVPSWSQAAVRWGVPALATLGTLPMAPTMTLVPFLIAYEILVYGGVLWASQSRGLHDRAAGTIVLRGFHHAR